MYASHSTFHVQLLKMPNTLHIMEKKANKSSGKEIKSKVNRKQQIIHCEALQKIKFFS